MEDGHSSKGMNAAMEKNSVAGEVPVPSIFTRSFRSIIYCVKGFVAVYLM